MKKVQALKWISLMMLIILTVVLFAIPVGASQVFTDLSPEHWCYNKIMEFEEKGYVCGYEDNTFRPDRTITRAEYVKIVNNFFGYELETEKESGFRDVNSGDWFAPYVNEAVERGYINGYEDGTFKPQDPIRRQEATVILARILNIHEEKYPENHQDGLAQYSDSDEVQEWAKVAIHSYSVYNFINGYEDGTLRILRNVTRAETVELLHVLEQKVVIDRPSGGGSSRNVKIPTITLWKEEISGEADVVYTCAQLTELGWLNKEEATLLDNNLGVLVNVTTTTNGAMIHESLDTREDVREYITTTIEDLTNKLFLTDGVYNISAYATKTGYIESSSADKEIKVDTMEPKVEGTVKETSTGTEIAHEQAIYVKIYDPMNAGVNQISELNQSKVRYAWFVETTDNETISYERLGNWENIELDENGQALIIAPKEYGSYKLGISAYDYAENSYGNLKDTVVIASGDNSGDTEEIPYDFVEEVEKEDGTSEDIIVIVGNNNPIVEDLVLNTKVNEIVSGEIIAYDVDSGDILTYELFSDTIEGASVLENITSFISSETGVYEYFVVVKDNYSGEAVAKVTVYVYDVEIEIPEVPEEPDMPNEPIIPDVDADTLVVFVGEEETLNAVVTPSGENIKNIEYNWNVIEEITKAEIDGANDEEEVIVVGKEPGETKIKLETQIEVDNDEIVIIEKEVKVIILSRITIQLPSDSKEYDGTPLTADDAKEKNGLEVIGGVVASGDVVDVAVSGEILYSGDTSVEMIENTFSVSSEENGDVTKYYVPTFLPGALIITPSSSLITIESVSGECWIYDGQEHTAEKYFVTFAGEEVVSDDSGKVFTLPTGDKITITNISNVKDVEDSAENNNIFEYVLENKEQYTNIDVTFGTMKIETRKVTLESATASKVYDGEALENDEVTVTGDGFVEGEGARYDVTGSQTEVGTSKNTFSYELTEVTSATNYEITKVEGDLEVTVLEEKVTVTITENSGDAKYDGEMHAVKGYEVEISNPLYTEADFTFNGTAVVEVTDAGTYEMELSKDDFTNTNTNFANVKFVIVDGILEITKRNVTLTSATDSKVYDGKALYNNEVTITGDGFVSGEANVRVTGEIIYCGEDDNTIEIEWLGKESNYNITKVEGTLRVTAILEEIIITAGSASKVYDGKALICDEYTYTQGILINGDVLEVVISGSQTEVGSSANRVTRYKVMNGTTDVTNCYTFGESINGTLTVKQPNILVATIKHDYATKESGMAIEPGEEITYNITLEEEGENESLEYPRTIYINLDIDVEAPKSLPAGAEYDSKNHRIVWTVNSSNDTLTYTVKVEEDTAAGSEVKTTLEGAKVKTSSIVDVEETGYVKQPVDKNIILVLDTSQSMTNKINSRESRFTVLKRSAKSFVNSIILEQDAEDITFSIVSFDRAATIEGSTMLNPEASDVNDIIDDLEWELYTNYDDAIAKTNQVLSSSSMLEGATNIVVFISDGDPTTKLTSANLAKFRAHKPNVFAIGIGDNYTRTYLEEVTGDRTKVFDATDETKLIAAFDAIFEAMFAQQSEEGILVATMEADEAIYPIKLSYINTSDALVNITVSAEDELALNNLSIVGNEVRWDISNYPGCTEFELEVSRNLVQPATLELLNLVNEKMILDEMFIENKIVSGDTSKLEKDSSTSGDVNKGTSKVETDGSTSGDVNKGTSKVETDSSTSGDVNKGTSKVETDSSTSGDVNKGTSKVETDGITSGDVNKGTSKVETDSSTSGDVNKGKSKVETDSSTSGDVNKGTSKVKTDSDTSGDSNKKALKAKKQKSASGDIEHKVEDKIINEFQNSENQNLKPLNLSDEQSPVILTEPQQELLKKDEEIAE